jgi:hypothetical protein
MLAEVETVVFHSLNNLKQRFFVRIPKVLSGLLSLRLRFLVRQAPTLLGFLISPLFA